MQPVRKPAPRKRVAKAGAVRDGALGTPNLDAAKSTIAALEGAGRLEVVDQALVTAVLSLATANDFGGGVCPNCKSAMLPNAALWKEYRAALAQLMAVGEGNSGDFELLMERLGRAAVVDETPA